MLNMRPPALSASSSSGRRAQPAQRRQPHRAHAMIRPHSSRGLQHRRPAFDAFKNLFGGNKSSGNSSSQQPQQGPPADEDEGSDMVPIGETGGVGGVSEEAFGPLVRGRHGALPLHPQHGSGAGVRAARQSGTQPGLGPHTPTRLHAGAKAQGLWRWAPSPPHPCCRHCWPWGSVRRRWSASGACWSAWMPTSCGWARVVAGGGGAAALPWTPAPSAPLACACPAGTCHAPSAAPASSLQAVRATPPVRDAPLPPRPPPPLLHRWRCSSSRGPRR